MNGDVNEDGGLRMSQDQHANHLENENLRPNVLKPTSQIRKHFPESWIWLNETIP